MSKLEKRPNNLQSSALLQAVVQQVAEVERADGKEIVISTATGIYRATVALSCLVQPACGDTVLVARHEQQFIVLAIIGRTSDASLKLQLPRDTVIEVEGTLKMNAAAMHFTAEDMAFSAENLSLWTRGVKWIAHRFELAAHTLHQTAHNASLRARGYQRTIEGVESVQAGHIDMKADELMHLRATHAVLKTKELVKIDGKQIQVG
jgi:Protein of unknown function (DUF3540)